MAKPIQDDDIKYDVRIRTHHLRAGTLADEELQAHLASLPDEAEEAAESAVRFTTPYADRIRRERGGKA